ncbi:MAG: cytochrome c/FTR1 family iron permease [Gemmatimonadota bacterium]
MTPRLFATLISSLALVTAPALAQEHPVRRVANIVSVAVEEYGRGVDAKGRLISSAEYQEATEFLADAITQAARLPGDRALARVLLDSLVAAVHAKQPPDVVKAIEQRFAASLGSEGALELPTKRTDLSEGGVLYTRNCARCHGPQGQGDGPDAKLYEPRPPAIGSAVDMRDRSPGAMYRVLSVGVAGTPMAGFASSLTADERWNIISYVMTLRSTPQRVAEGEGLYMRSCVSCHGALGAGDGALARTLSRMPQEIGSIAWQAARTDLQLLTVMREGIPGSAMPPSRELAPQQAANVVAYLRTLPFKLAPPAAQIAKGDPAAAAREVLSLLDQSLVAARAGREADAGDRAFDAYIAFEPLETPARARNPGLVAGMERRFADFRGAVRAGDVRGAERLRELIDANMPSVVALTRPTGSGLEAFWQSLLIILREGFEAILVIGAIVAFLIKTGHRDRLRSIWIGSGLGLAASAATAVVLKTVLSAMPMSREVIEGLTMLVAVAVLFSVSYWLISKVEAAKWQQFIREKVTHALEHGGGTALAFVAFLAVYREGAETALFYQALLNEGSQVVLPISAGILVGGAVLAVVFTLFHRYGVRIPLRPFFAVTSVLLYYMAFVFMGKGIRELQEGDVFSITVISGAPHVDMLGLYPSVETLLGQLVLLLLFIFALAWTFWPSRSVALPTIPSDPTAAVLVEVELADLRKRVAELEALKNETTRSGSDD